MLDIIFKDFKVINKNVIVIVKYFFRYMLLIWFGNYECFLRLYKVRNV